MDLYLVRHARAFQKDPDRWPHDSRRPLTPQGEEEFRLAARGLARIVPRVDVILSSHKQRAWQTAEILSELDSWPAPQPSPVLGPGSRQTSPEKTTLALEDYADAKSVAVIGPKPRLQALAAYLLCGEGDGMKMKIREGSVTCISFDGAPAPGLIHRSAWKTNSRKFAVASSPTRTGPYGVGVGLCGVAVAFWQHARHVSSEKS